MFSKRWSSRAAASHWLSPSVSMPTRRCTLAVLVRVAECDVPGVGLFVEGLVHWQTVDLHDELHRRLHGEIARASQDPPERCMHCERPDLVRVSSARFAVDPAEER